MHVYKYVTLKKYMYQIGSALVSERGVTRQDLNQN